MGGGADLVLDGLKVSLPLAVSLCSAGKIGSSRERTQSTVYSLVHWDCSRSGLILMSGRSGER